jgi:AbrB family looped-hinge helix DNA binding protein
MEDFFMKATGIVRRIDDLGRVVVPKEIRRTLRIREGDPLLTTLTQYEKPDKQGDCEDYAERIE